MTTKEQLEKLQRELAELDGIDEAEYQKRTEQDANAVAVRGRNSSGCNRAKAMGLPSGVIEKCPSTNKYGEPCSLQAGHGTDHYGQGLCKWHGGALQQATSQRPNSKRRYAHLANKELRTMMDHFEDDSDPLNLEQDIALLRSLTEKWVGDYDRWYELMNAWYDDHEAGNLGKPKPRKLLELPDAHKMLDSLAKMAKSEWQRRQNTAVTQIQLFRIMNQVGAIIMKHVTDEDTLKAIKEEMLKIRMPVTIAEQHHGL